MKEETIEDLQLDGLRLIQKKKGFRFGVDAVILSNFAKVKAGDSILDIGTGTGVIPILLSAKTKAQHLTGIEIQEHFAEMAKRSVDLNGLGDRISIVQGDIKDWLTIFGKAKFDLVVTNPPYIEHKTGLENESESVTIARHEVKCSLEDIVSAASGVLKPNGRLAMIHRPHRLVDILEVFRKFDIEPKYLQFVCSHRNESPVMVLIHGTKFGRKELRIQENLYIFDDKEEKE